MELLSRDRAGGNALEESDRLVFLLSRVDAPRATVPRDEFEEDEIAHPLVPVRQWVISDHMPGEDCRFLRELGICLDPLEAGSRCAES